MLTYVTIMTEFEHEKQTMDKRYWKHILWILVIKGILLTGMWYMFFRDEPHLDNKSAGNHIFTVNK